jgi:hypothetical protein
MKNWICLIVLVVFAFACSKDEPEPKFEPTAVTFSSGVVEKWPITDSNGSSWDFTSGPDTYVGLVREDGAVLATSTITPDREGNGPISFLISKTFNAAEFDENLFVILIDLDWEDDNDVIGGVGFQIQNFVKPNYTSKSQFPTKVKMTSPDGTFSVSLSVEWK